MTPIIIDAVVGIILLVSTVIATLRGFVREVLTILGLLGSMAVTWFWGNILESFYTGHLTNWAESKLEKASSEPITHLPIWKFDLPIDLLATVLSYGSIFMGIFIVFALLNLYISSLVQESELSTVDRSLGAMFGLARGVVLVVLLYMPVQLFIGEDGEKPEWLAQAKSVPLLEYSVDFVKTNLLPDKEDITKIVENITEKDSNKQKISDSVKNIKDATLKTIKDEVSGYEGSERMALDKLIEKEIGKKDTSGHN